jgi:hypothetical protein
LSENKTHNKQSNNQQPSSEQKVFLLPHLHLMWAVASVDLWSLVTRNPSNAVELQSIRRFNVRYLTLSFFLLPLNLLTPAPPFTPPIPIEKDAAFH